MNSVHQHSISMHDLREKLPHLSKGEIVLDVRTPEEFSEGHVPGAINIDHEEIANHLAQLKSYSAVYIHCRSGGRAKWTFDVLQSEGLKNLVCIGNTGMKDWIEAGYPVEK